MPDDLTVVYYTANHINDYFADNTRTQLLKAIGDIPIISVSKKPLDFGYNSKNFVVKLPRSQYSIYKQALIGVRAAQTKYVALAEDDVLYSPAHFRQRSSPGTFAYNIGTWSIFTWSKDPIFTCKLNGRINLNGLICERDLFIEALEERFRLWPNPEEIDKSIFGEPGKYDRHLGTTPRPTETFYTNPPNIVFSHETNLQFEGLGTRKAAGQIRAYEVPYWGRAEDILKLYKEN